MKSLNTSSVDKAFLLLEFLAGADAPVSLQEITDMVKLPKPTVYRLLRMLQELGYVLRPLNSRNYQIGPRAALLAAADPYAELKALAHPLLQNLHSAFNETVNLGILSGNKVLYLDFIETTEPLRFAVTPGKSDAWYSTSLGRAVASQLHPKTLQRLIAETRLEPLTPHTVTTHAALKSRIQKAYANGYAEELQESVEGVCCLAVSLAGKGFPDAAISIAVPTQRLTPKRRASILKSLKTIHKEK